MDCSTIANAQEFLQCSGEIIAPTIAAVTAVVGVAVAVALAFAAWRVVSRSIEEVVK